MTRITRSIELDDDVDSVLERWTEFEHLPQCAVSDIEGLVRYRAEVLTLEPLGSRTRLTIRIDSDQPVPDPRVPRRLQRTLETFRAFVQGRAGDQLRC